MSAASKWNEDRVRASFLKLSSEAQEDIDRKVAEMLVHLRCGGQLEWSSHVFVDGQFLAAAVCQKCGEVVMW